MSDSRIGQLVLNSSLRIELIGCQDSYLDTQISTEPSDL